MKLDLFNSRPLPFKKPEIEYDSISGEYIKDPTHTSTFSNISKISFNATGPKIDFMTQSCAPNIDCRSKIDHRGNIVDIANQLVQKPSKSVGGKVQSTFGRVDLEHEAMEKKMKEKTEEPYLPTLEKIKDKLYSPNYETLWGKVQEGRLPGANWSEVDRHVPVRPVYTGHDDLDKFTFERSIHGPKKIAVKFNSIPTGRGEAAHPVDEEKSRELMPLRIRRRLDRIDNAEKDKETRLIERKLKISSSLSHLSVDEFRSSFGDFSADTGPPSRTDPTRVSTGTIKFNGIDRFENPFYRQENYIKTGGMLLDNNWDKKLDKKIITGFNKGETVLHGGSSVANSSDVDVDVGYMYSTGYAVQKSPVRYSSAFRSKAPVGMEIRPTTSPDHIGPGSFTHGLPKGIDVYRPDLNSFFIVKERRMPTRPARPELTAPYPPFSEVHKAGPIFTKEGEMSGNVVLQNLVKGKMTQIYPKLAEKKFPTRKIKKHKSTKKIK